MTINTIVTSNGQLTYDRFHFAEAAESAGFIFCSGILGAKGGKVPEDIKEEFRHAWSAISALLEAADSDLNHIVEYTSYHVGLQSHLADFMAVRDEVLSEPWPAWTAIGITELAIPGAHVEIRVTAKKINAD